VLTSHLPAKKTERENPLLEVIGEDISEGSSKNLVFKVESVFRIFIFILSIVFIIFSPLFIIILSLNFSSPIES
jgi:hypothetical protein